MSKPASDKYKTTNWPSYHAALKSRGALMIWLDPVLKWAAEPTGKRGRNPTFSDAAIQLCLTIKCLFGLALRQATGMVESLLRLANLDWVVPDSSTISRRQKTLEVTIPARQSQGGLHLLVDSTGIKMLGEGEWKTKKHGAEYRRQWRKVHLGIDAETLEIRAIEVTDNKTGDAPMLPELMNQIPESEQIKECHNAIAARGAAAIIPTRKNAQFRKENTAGARARNAILRATKYLGRAIWKKWSGHHRRSLVETKMRCFKLLGERVMARDFERQVAELQVRVAILNRFTQLGTPTTVRVG